VERAERVAMGSASIAQDFLEQAERLKNTLAYSVVASRDNEKSFVTLALGKHISRDFK